MRVVSTPVSVIQVPCAKSPNSDIQFPKFHYTENPKKFSATNCDYPKNPKKSKNDMKLFQINFYEELSSYNIDRYPIPLSKAFFSHTSK